MPVEFDLSAVKANFDQYIKQIGDLLTSGPEMDRYMNFLSEIYSINSLTNFFYTPDANGNFPVMTEQQKAELMSAYQHAIREAAPILSGEETGPVGEAMRTITREMVPMLQMDSVALEMAGSEPLTLPQTISRGRTQIVDFGDQPMPVRSGASSQRRQITVSNGLTTENGFFTPTTVTDPDSDYVKLLDRLEKKYPPEYKPILDEMRRTKPARLNSMPGMPWAADFYRLAEGSTPEERRASMLFNLDTYFYEPVGVGTDTLNTLSQRPDFFAFSDELFDGVKQTVTDYDKYIAGSFLKLNPGANIDKRNTAVTRMAGLLGKPDLVAKSRPMTVIQNGVPVTGTFMEEAQGVDLTNIREGDPVLQYKDDAFDNPLVLEDIAAMQALDFITGNVDRHPGNYFLRFNPKDPENAKLVGLTLIDNDMSLSDANGTQRRGNMFVLPREMGVISEDVYNTMKSMTREQMELALKDCGLSREELDNAWNRKMTLQNKIERDMAHFEDKEVGYTEKGKIRLVKKGEWASYSVKKLARTHPNSQFVPIAGAHKLIEHNRVLKEQTDRRTAQRNALKQELGVPVPNEEKLPVPEGKIIGTGAVQNPDMPERADTVHLAIPPFSHVPSVGNNLSRRYLVSYPENDREKEVFFTPALDSGTRRGIDQIFRDAIAANPKYESELRMLLGYYTTDDAYNVDMPVLPANLPHRSVGFTDAQWQQLMADPDFPRIYENVSSAINGLSMRNSMLTVNGLQLGAGKRIELRNVAMSDVGDILGVSDDVLARSRPAQMMSGGDIIDGVIMDKAEGVDFQGLKGNHPVCRIREDKIDDVYNTESGLKSIADLQILDYVCLNIDRHPGNMTYRFKDLDTDDPKFLGVTGIDNDASFGAVIPDPAQSTNKLPPLNKIKVISEEMAEKLQDKNAAENIRKKMAENGLSEEEIQAAIGRMEQVREKIQSGDIRVVKKGEWTKGENSLSELSKTRDSLFSTVRNGFVKQTVARGKQWDQLPEDRKIPYQEKKLKFAKSSKVDGFGTAALNKKAFMELERRAEEEFLENIRNRATEIPAEEPGSEMEFVQKVVQSSAEMNDLLEKADPTLHRTSRAYKDLRKATADLKKLAVKLSEKLTKPEDVLSKADAEKLFRQMTKIRDCSEKYGLKKNAEVERGKELDTVEQQRISASANAGSKADSLSNEYDRVLRAQLAKQKPMKLVHSRLQAMQSGVSGLEGDKLHTRVATILYYKGLSAIGFDSKKQNYLKGALMTDSVKRERENIKKLPAFQKLCKMEDSELRELAAGKNADKLLDRFVKEMAKEKQKANQQEQLRKKEPKKDDPQNEADGNVLK